MMLLSQRAAWVWTTKPISDLSIYDREAFAFRIDDAGVFENLSPDDQRLILDAEANAGLSDKSLTAACSTCGEFACYSKACAPPPIGTGGSVATPSGRPADSSSSSAVLMNVVSSAAATTRDEFDHWLDKAGIFRRRSAACKMKAERTIVDELLSTEEGRQVIAEVLKLTTQASSEGSGLARLLTNEASLAGEFSVDLEGWGARSKRGLATIQDLIDAQIAADSELSTPQGRRRAARVMAGMGMDTDDASPERVAAHMVARMFIQNWADSSTSVGGSLQAQFAAQRRYGLKQGVEGSQTVEQAERRWATSKFADPVSKRVAEVVLDAEYRATQKFLKEILGPDVKTVTLYRGVVGQYGGNKSDEIVEVESHPLSSWSTSLGVAQRFGAENRNGKTLKMEVPIEMIQSTPLTGRGCLDEQEVVLIGYPSSALMLMG